jgi:hypothetical protein
VALPWTRNGWPGSPQCADRPAPLLSIRRRPGGK